METNQNISDHNGQNGLIEEKVGITEFVGVHSGFHASIKKRYSDFHVHEISPEGKTHHLSTLNIPKGRQPPAKGKSILPKEISKEQLQQLHKMSKKFEKIMVEAVDEQTGLNIQKVEDCKPIENVDIEVTKLNKDTRTAIHVFIKSEFDDFDSTTIEIEDKKYIQVKRKKAGFRERKNKLKGQECTHFVMYKENVDTMHAIGFLSNILKLKSSNFCYAGTKDKRGITSQAVSVFNIPPINILNACKPIRNVHVGDFSYSEKGLSLGMLGGNHFKIALRDVKATNNVIENACESLRSNGFINYYGMQRFGVRNTRTSDIGKELLHYRWQNAVNMILEPTATDPTDLMEAKKVYQKSGFGSQAYKILSGRSKTLIEGRLLHGLSLKHNNDFLNALQMIPRNTRTMYVHAYQSYVWNKVVSRRIKEFGLKTLIGDLIKGKQDVSDEEIEAEEGQALDQKVKHVDEETLCSTNVDEIVLPLPGHSVIYPGNVIKDWYSEILAEDGFTIHSFAGNIKQYTLRGAYRNILLKPKDFSSEICYYEDECKPLIQSDREKMTSMDISDNRLNEGTHKAVLLDFHLLPSTYATMALRELTKMTDGVLATEKNKRKADTENDSNKKQKKEHLPQDNLDTK